MSTQQGDYIEGTGTPGAPIGGVVTVQGTTGGTPQPTDVEQWGGAATTLGQKVSAASVPVVIASDQSALAENVIQWGAVSVTAAESIQNNRALPVIAPKVGAIGYLLNIAGTALNMLRAPTGDAMSGDSGILAVANFVWNGATFDRAEGDSTNGTKVSTKQTMLWQGGTSVANTALTITLPAGGAGIFHYITHIRIARISTAALAGSAVLTFTSTNLNGKTWATGNAAAAGVTNNDVDQMHTVPIKSQVANTATTIVAPACGAAVLSRIEVDYYTGPA